MRATEFEFRYRFWLIFLTYFVGFGSYTFDHLNSTEALVRWLFRASDPHLDSLAARHALQSLLVMSACLVAAAAWVRTWGTAYLRAEVVRDMNLHAEKLVADGPYRHIRNPLYFGNLLLAAGLALLASRTGAVVLFVGNFLIVRRLIGREEAALAESQGDGYRAYLAAVPRLWPSLRARVPAGSLQPQWTQAFFGELWVWLFAVNGFLFAWKLNGRLYNILLWASAAAYLLMWFVAARWRARNSPSPASPPSP